MNAGTEAEFAEHRARALRNPATLAFLAAQRAREAEVRAKADGEPAIRVQTGSADGLRLTVAWFENQGVKGEPAYGDPETTTWGEFASIFEWRREGEKTARISFPPASNWNQVVDRSIG